MQTGIHTHFTSCSNCAAGLNEDFEGDVSAWSATGLWHLNSTSCAPAASSPANAFYYGRDAGCDYDTGATTSGSLISPSISGIEATSTLTFAFRREVESFSGDFDRTAVDVSANGGSSWTEVWSLNSSDPSQDAWIQSPSIDLGSFAGDTIQVRFRFDSVDGQFNDFLGWMVDDVVVTSGSGG